MMIARDFRASRPVSPTTAAIAPNAPTGAAHMIMARMRKTRRWMWVMPRMIGSPAEPIAWSANPASRATRRVWSTSPAVKAETMVVGMMPSRKSTVDSLAPDACFSPAARAASVMWRVEPGSRKLPTSRPMARATVDMTRK
ncbi:hypothetical protein SMICM17S_01188 [Streptomyces microflavus]